MAFTRPPAVGPTVEGWLKPSSPSSEIQCLIERLSSRLTGFFGVENMRDDPSRPKLTGPKNQFQHPKIVVEMRVVMVSTQWTKVLDFRPTYESVAEAWELTQDNPVDGKRQCGV